MDPAEAAGDGFMVAHGYLSDDEGVHDEDDEMGNGGSQARQVDKNDLSETPASRDKGRAAPAPPKCYGCIWGDDAAAHSKLSRYKMVALQQLPIDVTLEEQAQQMAGDVDDAEERARNAADNAADNGIDTVTTVPDDLLPARECYVSATGPDDP